MSSLPPSDLGFIQTELRSVARNVMEAFDDNQYHLRAHLAFPVVLVGALEHLLVEIARHDFPSLDTNWEDNELPFNQLPLAKDQEVDSFLANYGLQLFADLAVWASVLGLSAAYDRLRQIGFAFGLWSVQHGAEVTALEPLVDNMAFIASNLTKPSDFEQLYIAASQIMDAVHPNLIQQDVKTGVGGAWRTLLLDRATIATRSQHPPFMEQAFQCLVELLPEAAADFFQDNITQLNFSQYPQSTRIVIEEYFQRWGAIKTLH